MAMRPTDFAGGVPIDGYGPGFVRVGGAVHYGAVIVSAGTVAPWGGMEDRAALLALAPGVDLLLIGTGREVAHAPPALLDALDAAGIRAEAMASPSAARSYNVLLSEGRRVAAALLPT